LTLRPNTKFSGGRKNEGSNTIEKKRNSVSENEGSELTVWDLFAYQSLKRGDRLIKPIYEVISSLSLKTSPYRPDPADSPRRIVFSKTCLFLLPLMEAFSYPSIGNPHPLPAPSRCPNPDPLPELLPPSWNLVEISTPLILSPLRPPLLS
jgi:hypothetical protein